MVTYCQDGFAEAVSIAPSGAAGEAVEARRFRPKPAGRQSAVNRALADRRAAMTSVR